MIFGKRVRLRKLERGDIPVFVEWLNDNDIRQFISLYLPISTLEEERWFDYNQNRSPDERPFAIEADTVEGWRLIGTCGLSDIEWRIRSAEYGIMIGDKNYWDQGYGTEITHLILRHGFETLNLNRIYLKVNSNNLRAKKAYEKAGFSHEGTMRQAEYMNGSYMDVELMSVLRDEWR